MSLSSGRRRHGASRGGSCGASSEYGPTAHDLNDRGITAVETPYKTHFHGDGDDNNSSHEEEDPRAVRAFARELMPKSDSSSPSIVGEEEVKARCTSLRSVLSGLYATEDLFNIAMFDAMDDFLRLLTPWVKAEKVDDTKIVLTELTGTAVAGDGRLYEYAAGLARESRLPPENGCIHASVARTDHAWVIFHRLVGSHEIWKVWRALAVVEFKRGYSAWSIARSDSGRGKVTKASLVLSRSQNGPLAQVIMYAMAHAVIGLASLGELPKSIPFAVIQCRRDASKVDVGWVHGNLVTPDACGERFRFSVDAYGSVHPDEASNGPPLAAYLDVLSNGLQVAKRWLQKLQRQPPTVLPAPHRLSGRELRFGEPSAGSGLTVIENATLLATPVLEYCAEANGFYRVHQGELFRTTVDLDLFWRISSSLNRVYWCPDAYPNHSTNSRAVLIKVTSKSCFNLLVPSRSALLYNVDLWWELRGDVRMALSGSLYGFYRTTDSCGLLQLLPDLRSLGYDSFPVNTRLSALMDWGALWRAFAGLVRNVLFPLARANIVHSDIRTGHDVTSNLLYNRHSTSMRLIDLDSLCTFDALLDLTEVNDPRYLSVETLPTPLKRARAMGFVLGQVLCAAEVWIGRIPHAGVDANDMVRQALPPRRTPSEAGGAEVGGGSLDSNARSCVFDDHAFDADGNLIAAVNEDLINVALDGYQKKFDRLLGE